MPQREITVVTPDGLCPASLHVPDGQGPWPAVIMYADAGGLRSMFRAMGERLSALGYVVLVPDFYYRHGDWTPFEMPLVFSDPDERQRLRSLMSTVTPALAVLDANAFVDYLRSLPEVTGSTVGTTGYCLGGKLSLVVAGRLGDDIASAASFHGGGLVTDAPDSPHRTVAAIRATVYVAGAVDDAGFTDEQRTTLERAFTEAGVDHLVETYPARHGFAVADSGVYDETADAQHWAAMSKLFGENLARSG